MKTSVVIATYNKPEYLDRSLLSYLRQRVLPDELVVADDGSGPETAAVIRDFAKKAPFPVIHAWQEDKGWRLAAVRNLATLKSTGDYLIYSDGDCVAGPHFIADHIRLARPGAFVQGRRVMVQRQASESFTGGESFLALLRLWLGGGLKKAKLYKLLHVPGLSYVRKGFKLTIGSNMAFFREDLFRVNGWDERFEGWGCEDEDIALRFQRAGVRRRVALCSAVVFHLYHEQGSGADPLALERVRNSAPNVTAFVSQGLVK
ncbi:MAG: glycosyltransferase family 2 protein [Planctomycetes bacterium]|nr:glycosyltransferase family 2 protein [Planctomycetota bacterium]